jgi:uncharacterized cupin superfamily protein
VPAGAGEARRLGGERVEVVSIVYVFRSELEIRFEDQTTTLGVGDSLTFSPTGPHT